MDWEELNPDLLHLIVKKLGDISNFIRFRVVCKRWCLAAPTSDPPPQLPWLLACYPNIVNKSYHRFYSLYANKTQNLHLPQAEWDRISFGSSSQYVHMFDQPNPEYPDPFMYLKLLNPLTGSEIPMPLTEVNRVLIPLEEKNRWLWRYIGSIHSCNPNQTCNGTEAIIAMPIGQHPLYNSFPIVFLLLNYKKETTTSLTKHILQRKIVIYEPRSLVATKLLDITTRDVVPVFTKKGLKFSYLLEACGDVLGVVRHIKAFDLDIEVIFEVYRLEDNGTPPHWTKMNDGIGDRMLFLDCMGGVGFCLNANHFPGLKGNCIYFQESNQIYLYGMDDAYHNGFVVGRFDIKEGTTQLLSRGIFPGVWFVPRLLINF